MDRNALLRISLILLAGLLFWKFGSKGCGGEQAAELPKLAAYTSAPDFIADGVDDPPGKPTEGALCVVRGKGFQAELSSRGAAVVHYGLTDAPYAAGANAPMELGTTPDHERFRPLRTSFRGAGADTQFAYDRFNWTLATDAEPGACAFTYKDEGVSVRKTFKATGRPYELALETTVTNLASAPKKHQLQVGAYAFRRNEEVKGHLGRVSPNVTDLSCAKGDEIVHKGKDDFKEGPFTLPAVDRYLAVSTAFFAQAIVPAAGTADCTLGVLKFPANGKLDDDLAGALYEGRLTYPAKELAPKESVTYAQTVYQGPKDRTLLPAANDGKGQLGGLITYSSFLGLPLAPVAKVLVAGLTFFHGKVNNWGIAIILLTIALKLCLLPLAIPGIKNSIKLRKIKPELDELKRKFPDDLQGRQLATMELHKKHGVSMVTGCLPQLATMPIWVAMYSTIQTAVEFYHVKFLWFSDMSLPDKYFVLPLLLGGFMLLQTKVVPQQQEMDPAQQKMMTFMMPVVFTVMMLFLPAALGVYMLTNSILNILQTLGVEAYARRAVAAAQSSEIVVKPV